ncbi:hypothetical protein K469DRAFT_190508 [Zopfia rhizophila CBS 207.26]|uniref:Uncharacterized protein n=1 Tax=Zopfia rhizophila CBS 207.26 TaxID=1314779 RepID=A0A6A6EVZ2_9PEZI|nr:hypothetical protein K469DRAFT_190508 [Zopfia rhizophila CBS 207.26]
MHICARTILAFEASPSALVEGVQRDVFKDGYTWPSNLYRGGNDHIFNLLSLQPCIHSTNITISEIITRSSLLLRSRNLVDILRFHYPTSTLHDPNSFQCSAAPGPKILQHMATLQYPTPAYSTQTRSYSYANLADSDPHPRQPMGHNTARHFQTSHRTSALATWRIDQAVGSQYFCTSLVQIFMAVLILGDVAKARGEADYYFILVAMAGRLSPAPQHPPLQATYQHDE